MSTDRTPLQAAAKRVYEALEEASGHTAFLYSHLPNDAQAFAIGRTDRAIEDTFEAISKLMHEGDCE